MFQYSNIIISYWILINFHSKEGMRFSSENSTAVVTPRWVKVESLPLLGGHTCPDVPPTESPKEPGCSCLVRNQQEAKATERDFRVKLALELWVDSWQGKKPAWVRLASLARGWMVQQCPGNFRIIDSSMGTSPSSKQNFIYIYPYIYRKSMKSSWLFLLACSSRASLHHTFQGDACLQT